ncbi:MAG: hypothetical protein EXX96DRAFT_599740 [Benjaminiella poitrasii]|nr:MAG: hypothetical protein EXX96DRAFT_599740 [Benjaminiella poitrasii]
MKEATIREYTSNDQEIFKRFYINMETKKRTNQVLRALKQRTSAKQTWQAGMIGILSIHLTQILKLSITLKHATLIMAETLIWSAGVGIVWYKWICQEYNNELKRTSEHMAIELSNIQTNEKSNAWIMERDGEIVGTVALKYEKGEGKIGYLTGLDSQIRLMLVQNAFRFGRVNKIELNTQLPLQFLFSPTTLIKDLTYVDETYYRNIFRDSFNKLTKLPATIDRLVNLTHLNLSNNRITVLPDEIFHLRNLEHLNVSSNPLNRIPPEIKLLFNLETLDISRTLVAHIPAEIVTLMRITLIVNDCRNLQSRVRKIQQIITHGPPSLFEICARQVVHPILTDVLQTKKTSKMRQKILAKREKWLKKLRVLPDPVLQYLLRPKGCSFCGGPYFDTCNLRYRIIRYNDEMLIPVEYRLCSAHWRANDDYLLAVCSDMPRLSLPLAVDPLHVIMSAFYNLSH